MLLRCARARARAHLNTTGSQPAQAGALSLRVAMLLSLVGGFLDAYTYLDHGGVFAGAQSGNVVLMAISAARGEWAQALRHVPSILAFCLGVAAAEGLRRLRRPPLGLSTPAFVLLVEACLLFLVGSLSPVVPDQLVIIVVAFAAALQLSSFGLLHRWNYNSTMTTGNLRTAVQSTMRWLIDRKPDARAEALNLGGVIVGFAVGAAAGGVLSVLLHHQAIWIAAVLLCLVMPMVGHRARTSGTDS